MLHAWTLTTFDAGMPNSETDNTLDIAFAGDEVFVLQDGSTRSVSTGRKDRGAWPPAPRVAQTEAGGRGSRKNLALDIPSRLRG